MIKTFINNLESITKFKKIIVNISDETMWYVDLLGMKMEIIRIEKWNLYFLNSLSKKVAQVQNYLKDLDELKTDQSEIVFFKQQSQKMHDALNRCIELHKKYEPDLLEIKKYFNFLFAKKNKFVKNDYHNIEENYVERNYFSSKFENEPQHNFDFYNNTLDNKNNFSNNFKFNQHNEFKDHNFDFIKITQENTKISKDLLEKLKKLKDI